MKEKKVFYSEAAYGVGVLLLALGTGLMERADFGLSMVVRFCHYKLAAFR